MCGVAGAIDLDGKNIGSRVKRMVAILRHRGPDGWGVLEPAPGVAIGHARLAVVDPSGGAQPLLRGSLSATVNGQLYDYATIRKDLEAVGVRFATHCDSELVLPLYERYGEAFIQHLRGEFALAIYDRDRRRLLLARDPLGVRPLFYSIGTRHVIFGSEIKALFAYGMPRELSAEGVAAQLMFVLPPGGTPFAGVHELRPGHLLVVQETAGRLEAVVHRWWTLPNPSDHHAFPDRWKAVAGQLQSTLRAAVKSRLHSDAPIACYLSGGIDSTAVSALAKEANRAPIPALTVGFEDPAYDESGLAAQTAALLGVPHHVCRLSGEELFGRAYEDTVWHTERVMYGTLGVARRHLASFARSRGFKVVLTGDGADELFGGYVQFERDMALAAPDSFRRIAELHRRHGLTEPPAEEEFSHPALESEWGGTPSWIQTWLWALHQLRPLLSDHLLAALHNHDPVLDLALSLDGQSIRRMHPLDRGQTTWIGTMLPSYILGWSADRVEMAHGIESRPPFLDPAVVELARRLPPAWRIRDGAVKWLFRESLVGVVPEATRLRRKRGFVAPLGRQFPRWISFVNHWLAPDRVQAAGLFDPGRLGRFLNQSLEGYPAHQHEKLLHQLVCLHVMHERLCMADLPAMAARLADRM